MSLNFMQIVSRWFFISIVLIFKCFFIEANIDWNLPVIVTEGNVDNAQIAIDNAGNIIIVWEEEFLPGFHPRFCSIIGTVLNNQLSFMPVFNSNYLVQKGSVKLSMNGAGKTVAVSLFLIEPVRVSTLQTSLKQPWSTQFLNTGSVEKKKLDLAVRVDEDGNTLVIWLQSDGVQGASQIVNGEWSDPVTISQKGEFQVFSSPQIAVNGGIGAAVWEVKNSLNETKIIQGAIAEIHESVVWNKQVSLSDPLGRSSSPQVAVGSNGRAVAIWRNSNLIQCTNNSDNPGDEWVDPVTLINNVTQEGYQSVTVESESALAYWTNEDNVQISNSSLETPKVVWSGAVSFPTDFSLSSSLDATIFQGKPQVIWSQKVSDYSLIEVGSINSRGDPEVSRLTATHDPDDPRAMVASNKNDTIVAIWLQNIRRQDGSIVRGLMAANGKYKPEISKMLMYWGVDEPFQRDLP